jgi:ribosomal small subunit protein bTHX
MLRVLFKVSTHLLHKAQIMGKGDIKTKKGKITKGSFGNSRKHKALKDKPASPPPAKGAAKAPSPPSAAES